MAAPVQKSGSRNPFLETQLLAAVMIVCLCHRVSDRDIHRVVGEGVTNFELLQDLTRVASNCGNCMECAQMVFEEACAAQGHGHAHCHATAAPTSA